MENLKPTMNIKTDGRNILLDIYAPNKLEDAILQGKMFYKTFSNKSESNFNYIDEITSLYFGAVLWYLKSLETKYKVELLNYNVFKSFLTIEATSIPVILTFSSKEIEQANIIPSDQLFGRIVGRSLVKYIISGVSVIFSEKIESSLVDNLIMNIFQKEVENEMNDIKWKLKTIYLNSEDELYDEMKLLKLWLKCYK